MAHCEGHCFINLFQKVVAYTRQPVSLSEQDSTAVRRRHGPLRGPFSLRQGWKPVRVKTP
jgi:hypothetical protein